MEENKMDARAKFQDIPERLAGLTELAYNFWWSWNNEARMLFKILDRSEWKLSVHNPVKMLCNIDKNILIKSAKDQKFLRHYDAVMARFKDYMKKENNWFFENIDNNEDLSITFFSAEYGLHHSLPFYAGGLGFLAGDLLKECSDLGIPMIGLGFMYPEGYLRQRITVDGWQINQDETLERENASISRVFDKKGEKLLVKIPVIEPPIFVEVWRVQIGKVVLYLIDTDIDKNDPWNRSITSHLYSGNIEQRLRQEIVLGIGGTEVLNTLGIACSVLHLNEGHTAFAILERIRENIEKGMDFDDAFERVKSTTIFTTHTPVAAGHDVFPFPMVEKYFGSYWSSLKLDRDTFLKLGFDPNNPTAGFNMTAFALRASLYHNGVSKRHGEVARKMWESLWPDLSVDKIPIDSITNGIHLSTWIEPRMKILFDKYLGPNWLSEQDNLDIWELIDDIPDSGLWDTHNWLKTKLVLRIMERAREIWMKENPDPRIILASGGLLDPTILTIGFARRFATYKRATLILQDIQRLKNILNDRWRPMQIIFAGKAHPNDDQGKRLLQEIFNVAKDPTFGGRIAFVEDYDEQLAQYFVHGVDVWLNNPLPPYEACGTSGMKASLNGVPHLSILDGWWIEGFNGKNGWAFGNKKMEQDNHNDAESLYDVLEKKIIPLYYNVDDEGIPSEWVKVMKEAIKSTAPKFNSRRMTKEYALKYYQNALKSASNFHQLEIKKQYNPP
jgi:starch phosphorylase